MKTLICITAISTFLFYAGCSTTTYVSLTENNKEQVEEQLKYDEQDENVGAEVTLSLINGTEINGELLSIRDSTIILDKKDYPNPITAVRTDEIQEITIEGSNYVLAGLGIGIVAGTLTGILVGSLLEENRQAYVSHEAGLGVLGFIVGAIAGPIIGYALSSEEFVVQEIPPGYDFSFLKPLARYSAEEPEYLRAIK